MTGGLVTREGIEYYRIDEVDRLRPFLMTVASESDLWMFVSSTGALTAGRIDADHAIFPYETDDRLHRNVGLAGPVTSIVRRVDGQRHVWRPFAREVAPGCTRAIAKSVQGDRLVFEEQNHEWQLEFRATWAAARDHGWVRNVELIAHGDWTGRVEVLDGFLDVMPAGVDALTEQIRSNLVDAYKRAELVDERAAIYSLESLITDRAEPAEALTATVVWSSGLPGARIDLNPDAVGDVSVGDDSPPTRLLTGRPGAYLLRGDVELSRSSPAGWMLVADTGLGHDRVVETQRLAQRSDAAALVAEDVDRGSQRLGRMLARADGHQSTGDPIADAHHVSNVLFNSMRGGLFPHDHQVPIADFRGFVERWNRQVFDRNRTWLASLGDSLDVGELRIAALATGDADLVRLALEYLPLTFARRHGDPSRPWNRFAIHTRDDRGDELLAYEGNWRDIFQNWEALLQSYPAYFGHVVAKFVNASTIDGHNPYRISQDGIDWEVPDPDDPWSHIGYWGDHQIVYLHRLLAAWQRTDPDALADWLDREVFVFADVPYDVAPHDEMVANPRDTITYSEPRAAAIAARERAIGADGRLLVEADGSIARVGLLEKLLVPALAKISSLVPGGGIWLNTQRPEWNDANNALAGPGLSMVTLCHLHAYLRFLGEVIDARGDAPIRLSPSVIQWVADLRVVADTLSSSGAASDDHIRRAAVDSLGRAAEAHRRRVAAGPVPGREDVDPRELLVLCQVVAAHLHDTIIANRRDDGLFHSYNRVDFPDDTTARIEHLGPMLEGQVAVLSSASLDAEASLGVIEALFDSDMYRADQETFMLYPAPALASFLDRNRIPSLAAQRLAAIDIDLSRVLVADADGVLRFRPGLTNAVALQRVLGDLGLAERDRLLVERVYEDVFHHRWFTGRSGGMYGYEGIGSVYWHMVAKLLLAVQEVYWAAVDRGDETDVIERLGTAYRRVRAGLGFRKDPRSYGAFPTDCYSHTPAHAGAQQPGMTGQVKEEILTRFGELGLRIVGGRLLLQPGLLPPGEVLPAGDDQVSGSARFTLCSVPMVIAVGDDDAVVVEYAAGPRRAFAGLELPRPESQDVVSRQGIVDGVEWTVGAERFAAWARSS